MRGFLNDVTLARSSPFYNGVNYSILINSITTIIIGIIISQKSSYINIQRRPLYREISLNHRVHPIFGESLVDHEL